MRILQFLLFFCLAFGIYFGVNYYIYIHGLRAFSSPPLLNQVYRYLFILLAAAYILGRILERIALGKVSTLLTWIGSFWLAAMVYFLLVVIVIDVVRLVNHFLPVLPYFVRNHPLKTNFFLGIASLAIVILIVIAGRLSALNPRIKTLELSIPKKIKGQNPVTIAFVSDIHLGTAVGPRHLRQMVTTINAIKPDLVLLGGDVVDEDLKPVIRKNLGACLKEIETPMGLFSITGNHEYIGGVEQASTYLQEHGITVLRDSVVQLENGIIIIGRNDRDSERFSDVKRAKLRELVKSIDPSYPIILLDHQPTKLEDALDNRVDLQLSAHTHHGQLWPFNYITSAVYRIGYGYEKIGNTHFYVSCGYGIWGPPIRTSSRPEIVVITLTFSKTTKSPGPEDM